MKHKLYRADSYGSLTFSDKVMRDKLPQDVYYALMNTIKHSEALNPELANAIAHGMKEWALEHEVTHYSHWFQPLTGYTAEKHDSFITFDQNGKVFERFSGKQLIQSEPDASSFPSGGMRSTFEARGYTAWDPRSPAFILKNGEVGTLCIPSVFISYHGHALDEKTPLLKSCAVLSDTAVKLLHLIGKNNITEVVAKVGAEQEYFLVDKDMADKRIDLKFCGRTLSGALPPKGQQLDDHYFGVIPERVIAYMEDVEQELYLLGIPAKTRHNEVAPQQYELAVLFEDVNLACDHNLLMMEVMRKTAYAHGFKLLLHEKPFAGINGSGKHNNWSLFDSEGHNLFKPNTDLQQNLCFLLFLVATVTGVYQRADLLRVAVATAGNDHRLGGNEAPPSIISVFLGEQLNEILNLIETGDYDCTIKPHLVNLGLDHLPQVLMDNTDRNRTSPFAFTGNKFEFRAVPSSIPLAFPNTVINLAVTEALDQMYQFMKELLSKDMIMEQAIIETLRHFIKLSKPIRYEGDNYTGEWVKEATRRGLPHRRNTPEALSALIDAGHQALFTKYNILSDYELNALYHIRMEQYCTKIEVEANTMVRMIQTGYLPAAIKTIKDNAKAEKNLDKQSELQTWLAGIKQTANALSKHDKLLKEHLIALNETAAVAEKAVYIIEKVLPVMAQLRIIIDELEMQMDFNEFPYPIYSDLLFNLNR